MKNLIKRIIGKDIQGFSIYDAKYDAKKGITTLVCEPYEMSTVYGERDSTINRSQTQQKEYIERKNPDEPVLHTIVFDGFCGVDYTIDGKPDELAYESFINSIFGQSHPSSMNYIFGIPSKTDIEKFIFNNIVDYLLDDDEARVNRYGNCITICSMTSLYLAVLRKLGIKVNKEDLAQDVAKKLNEMMIRYLDEHPEHIQKIQAINEKLSNLEDSVAKESQPDEQLSIFNK